MEQQIELEKSIKTATAVSQIEAASYPISAPISTPLFPSLFFALPFRPSPNPLCLLSYLVKARAAAVPATLASSCQ